MIELMGHAPAAARMLAEINAERLRELQRFAELGRVSAGLIHDISSPLTAAILHLEQEEHRDLLAIRHARRSIRMLERYIEAARQQLRQESRPTNFCVKGQLCQVKRIVVPAANRRHVRLRFRIDENYRLVGDPVKFQQIMTNLITNSVDAYEDRLGVAGQAIVKVSVSACCKWLNIRVRDWGGGIAAEELPRIFEPFYTTKRASAISGLGIGLSTVKRYVEQDFGGEIRVASTPGKGTEFILRLQRVSPKPDKC